MSVISMDNPGEELLLMGNEAIARGALEAGVKVATAYPGTPSSEIIGSLAEVSRELDLYVEWSVNEKVALEVAAAASFTGLRAITAMKQNGINVASDFLLNLNLIGTQGGILLVTCDDPSSHSSTNEQDTRAYSKMADLPLLEPSTFQEAKEMTRWAFSLSEEIGNVCMMRSVTRISHARGNVTLGKLLQRKAKPFFDTKIQRLTHPVIQRHKILHDKLDRIRDIFDQSEFNQYVGPENADLLIITCGSGWLYSQESLELLGLKDSVGILKIGTTWPLPEKTILKHLAKIEKVLIVEEVDPFLEGNIKELAADYVRQISPKTFYGKRSHHIPYTGEMDTDRIVGALKRIFSLDYRPVSSKYSTSAEDAKKILPNRVIGFCPGCPHRASLWNIKNALQLDNRNGFVTGDIGCYALARTTAGYQLSKTSGAMGSGTGLAAGFGKLGRFGFNQPVVSLCGDSTFFHAALPALVNAQYTRSNMLMVILDNSTTAMTGFQSHPGIANHITDEEVSPIDIESLCRSVGAKVEVTDPFDIKASQSKLLAMLEEPSGVKVLIMHRKCELLRSKNEKQPYRMRVDKDACIGENCGCNRFCTSQFKCPGLVWDGSQGKAMIDEVICVGCGICSDVCPTGAIVKEEV